MSDHRYRSFTSTKPKTNKVDLSQKILTTLDFFRLQPVYCCEAIPGDSFNVNMRAFVEASPLATKVFGDAHLDLHAFFVPTRLLWKDWNNYSLGNSRNSLPGTGYTQPYLNGQDLVQLFGLSTDPSSPSPSELALFKNRRRVFGSLGYPIPGMGSETTWNFDALAFQARAYQQIWWDYYRDSINIPESAKSGYLYTDGGTQTSTLSSQFTTRYRCFKKDFISTLLANPQMGSDSLAKGINNFDGDTVRSFVLSSTQYDQASSGPVGSFPTAPAGGIVPTNNVASYSSKLLAPSISIAAIRFANAQQRYLERLNLTGIRPLERILSKFGMDPLGIKKDMAEFIGGKTIKVSIDGITNNSSGTSIDTDNVFGVPTIGESGSNIGMGTQIGKANAIGQSDEFRYSASEHGFFIIIASIMPEFYHPNRIEKQFVRGLSVDGYNEYYQPDFDGIGYEEVTAEEVYVPDPHDSEQHTTWRDQYDPYQVVGYQPRYESYRFKMDNVSGDFTEYVNRNSMPNLYFSLRYPDIISAPSSLVAGLGITTSNHTTRELFDNHFTITDSHYDHFVLNAYVANDAYRPISMAQLPTELIDLNNQVPNDVSSQGVRL